MAHEIAVIGAGTMGAGIAQLALEHGHPVRLIDVEPAAAERARARIGDASPAGSPGRGLAGADSRHPQADVLERLSFGTESRRGRRGGRRDRGRRSRTLDRQAGPVRPARPVRRRRTSILATNTSALSVGAIAAAARLHPERVVGLHFFNPAPVMPLVEVVAGPRSRARPSSRPPPRSSRAGAGRPSGALTGPASSSTGSTGRSRSRPCGCVEAGEPTSPRSTRRFTASGFPLGPFELMDLVGIDVNLAAATGIWEGFDRAAPVPAVADPGGARRRRPARPQVRRRLLSLRRGRRAWLGPGAEFAARQHGRGGPGGAERPCRSSTGSAWRSPTRPSGPSMKASPPTRRRSTWRCASARAIPRAPSPGRAAAACPASWPTWRRWRRRPGCIHARRRAPRRLGEGLGRESTCDRLAIGLISTGAGRAMVPSRPGVPRRDPALRCAPPLFGIRAQEVDHGPPIDVIASLPSESPPARSS